MIEVLLRLCLGVMYNAINQLSRVPVSFYPENIFSAILSMLNYTTQLLNHKLMVKICLKTFL